MRLKTSIVSLFAFILAGLSSCSIGPDVRIVLCQDMTMKLLNTDKSGLEWLEEAKVITKQYDEAQIVLQYKQGSDSGKSICHYEYERYVEVEEGDELIDPLSVYSTYPKQVNLNNKIITGKVLTDLVNEVMLMQGKAFIKKIEDKTQKVVEKIK